MSNFESEYTESEQEYIREFYQITLRACVEFDGNIAACWAEMVEMVGREIAFEIFDHVRSSALAGWGTERVQAWAASVSGEKQ